MAPTDAKPIEPALSAEEWAEEKAKTPPAGTLSWALRHIDADLLPAHVAMANFRLPDDSPYKITKEDVRLLLNASSGFIHEASRQDMALRSLAAKLAALLPPHE